MLSMRLGDASFLGYCDNWQTELPLLILYIIVPRSDEGEYLSDGLFKCLPNVSTVDFWEVPLLDVVP